MFTDGIVEGLNIVIRIFPYILAITMAITLMTETGALNLLIAPIKPLLIKLGIPEAIIPLAIFKPFSGSGSMSIVMEIFKKYGPDSIEGKMASIIMGGTETTFYIITILFGSIGIKKIRGTLIAALIADVIAVATTIILVNLKLI